MKILNLSMCLALVAMAAAESGKAAGDPTASVSSQSVNDLIAKMESLPDEQLLTVRDMLADAASEYDFRVLYLSGPKIKPNGAEKLIPLPIPIPKPTSIPLPPLPLPSLPIPNVACIAIKTVLVTALKALSAALKSQGQVPVLGALFFHLSNLVEMLIKQLQPDILGIPLPLFGHIKADLDAVSKLVAFAVVGKVPEIGEVVTGLSTVTTGLDKLTNCEDCKKQSSVDRLQSEGSDPLASLEQKRCYALADLYRAAIDEAIQVLPKADDGSNDGIPIDTTNGSPEQLEQKKRLVTGALSVLDLMAHYTIPAENENLFKSKPVFYVGDLLDQYRSQLEPLAVTEKERLFTSVSLPVLVGVSHALEACLHIAADPVAAKQELRFEIGEEEAFE